MLKRIAGVDFRSYVPSWGSVGQSGPTAMCPLTHTGLQNIREALRDRDRQPCVRWHIQDYRILQSLCVETCWCGSNMTILVFTGRKVQASIAFVYHFRVHTQYPPYGTDEGANCWMWKDILIVNVFGCQPLHHSNKKGVHNGSGILVAHCARHWLGYCTVWLYWYLTWNDHHPSIQNRQRGCYRTDIPSIESADRPTNMELKIPLFAVVLCRQDMLV